MRTQKPKVILVFGEPNAGKSWLASRIVPDGGNVIRIDNWYLDFVKDLYPKLYLESLNIVISQHYKTILSQEKEAYNEWREYVYNGLEDIIYDRPVSIVEGYLLAPILRSLKARLKKMAEVEVIYVSDKHYYKETRLKDLLP